MRAPLVSALAPITGFEIVSYVKGGSAVSMIFPTGRASGAFASLDGQFTIKAPVTLQADMSKGKNDSYTFTADITNETDKPLNVVVGVALYDENGNTLCHWTANVLVPVGQTVTATGSCTARAGTYEKVRKCRMDASSTRVK
jgi:hypothetical protein